MHDNGEVSSHVRKDLPTETHHLVYLVVARILVNFGIRCLLRLLTTMKATSPFLLGLRSAVGHPPTASLRSTLALCKSSLQQFLQFKADQFAYRPIYNEQYFAQERARIAARKGKQHRRHASSSSSHPSQSSSSRSQSSSPPHAQLMANERVMQKQAAKLTNILGYTVGPTMAAAMAMPVRPTQWHS